MRPYALLGAALILSLGSCAGYAQELQSGVEQIGKTVDPGSISWDGDAHRGPVLDLAWDETRKLLLSAGSDGFVVTWDPSTGTALDRYQYGPYRIQSLSVRPEKQQFAILETDGIGLFRLSAWDYARRERLFSLRFKDSVSFVAYSGQGNYILLGRSASSGVTVLRADDGSLVKTVAESVVPSFAQTGKSERSMVCYASTGSVSYWDLTNGKLLQQTPAPAGLSALRLFGNNRLMAGRDASGLVVFDALSGAVRSQRPFPAGSAMAAAAGGLATLADYGAEADLSLVPAEQVGQDQPTVTLPFPWSATSSCSDGSDTMFLGLDNGSIVSVRLGSAAVVPHLFQTSKRERIRDLAVDRDSLVLLGDGAAYRIPQNPAKLLDGSAISPFAARTEDRVAALDDGTLVLWNSDGTGSPILYGADGEGHPLPLDFQAPVIRGAALGTLALFLDAKGNLNVLDAEAPRQDAAPGSTDRGRLLRSYSAVGMLDAAFKDPRTVLFGRSVVPPQTRDLMTVDVGTGETAPVETGPAAAGGSAVVRLRRGSSGAVYAIRVEGAGDSQNTTLVRLDASGETPLIAYKAEDVNATLAEAGTSVGTTLGGDGAFGIGWDGFFTFGRGPALPTRLEGTGSYFVAVDSDGGIVWNSAADGAFVARLSLTAKGWIMIGADGVRRSGPLTMAPDEG